nr:hypothetical protein [Tanacetum cinerariifolium]
MGKIPILQALSSYERLKPDTCLTCCPKHPESAEPIGPHLSAACQVSAFHPHFHTYHSLILTLEFGLGVTLEARLTCVYFSCVGTSHHRRLEKLNTDKACDAAKNGISECFNALILDVRRKPIINMLEDIRVLCIERLQKMREKHEKWNDGICSNIRTKLEKLKDIHRNWKVVLSGESKFEVRNCYEGFKPHKVFMLWLWKKGYKSKP